MTEHLWSQTVLLSPSTCSIAQSLQFHSKQASGRAAGAPERPETPKVCSPLWASGAELAFAFQKTSGPVGRGCLSTLLPILCKVLKPYLYNLLRFGRGHCSLLYGGPLGRNGCALTLARLGKLPPRIMTLDIGSIHIDSL